jgi:outer membrane biosynthesis protein TonB
MLTTWRTKALISSLAAIAWALGLAPGAMAWVWPADGPVLRGFELGDNEYAGGQHRGIDIALAGAATVRAPAAGEVTFAGQVPTHGLTVTIATADGHKASLTHLGQLLVKRGSRVDEGATVAQAGPSGTAEFDVPYVHLGIRVGESETYVDPLGLLPARATAPPPPPPPPPAPTPAPAPAPPSSPSPAPTLPPPAAPEPSQASPPQAEVPTPTPVPAPTRSAPAPAPAEAKGASAESESTRPSAKTAAGTSARPRRTTATLRHVHLGRPRDGSSVVADRSAQQNGRSLRQPSASGIRRTPRPGPLSGEPPAAAASPGSAGALGRELRPSGSSSRGATWGGSDGMPGRRDLEPRNEDDADPLAPVITPVLATACLAGLLALVAGLLAARAGRRRLHIIDRLEHDSTSSEDPRRGGVAVRLGATSHRPCGGVRGALGHVCEVPPSARKRRPHGQRNGRARDAGHGRGGRRGRVAA